MSKSAGAGVITVPVTQGTNLALALNPAGDTLALSIQGVLFSMPVGGGDAQPLTDVWQDAREPVWHPNGNQLTFQGYARGSWDLYSVAATGGSPVPLTGGPFDDREPIWAADGSQLFFSSDRSGNYDIWSRSATGELRAITTSPVDEHSPAVDSNGRLAWVASSATGGDELWLLEPGQPATAARRLRAGLGKIAGVAFSPGGAQLSYQVLLRDRAGAGGTELRVVQLATMAEAMVSPVGADVFPFRAAWVDEQTLLQPIDGEVRRWQAGQWTSVPFVAALELRRPPWQRRQRDHDGTDARQALGIVMPVISPDGATVAFTALGDLWLWRPATGDLQQLTDDPAAESYPTFAPDGRTLLYVSDAGGLPTLRSWDLAAASGGGFDALGGAVGIPVFSPDGKKIAFFRSTPGNPLGARLIVLDVANRTLRVVSDPIPPQPISWSADGSQVAAATLVPYSNRYREGVYQLAMINVASGKVTRVAPEAHRTIRDAVLTPDGLGMSYLVGARLWRINLDEAQQPQGVPQPLTGELTDAPSWSASGKFIVYLSGARLKRLDVAKGTVDDITPPLPWRRDVPTDRWVLRAGRLFAGTGDSYMPGPLDIVVRGHRIESIGPVDANTADPVVDASAFTVMPGLFEMHAHLGPESGTQGRGWLAWGITSVRDPGSDPYVAKARQEAWDSGRRLGPRTHLTGYLTDGTRVYYSISEGVISDQHLEMTLQRAAALKLDFIKTYVRLPPAQQRRVVEVAHQLGIPVSSHEIFPAAAHGMDHVEHISGTSRRGYFPKVSLLGRTYGDVVELLVGSGMAITPTAVLPGFALTVADQDDLFTSVQFQTVYGPGARRQYGLIMNAFAPNAAAVMEGYGAFLRVLAKRNALVVAGTDAPFVPYGAGLHGELRLYERAGLSTAQVLQSATRQAALAAGVGRDLGTVETGKLADMVVIDGDPLASLADADNVVMTVRNGRMYRLADLLRR